jgi:hypothetical protein
MKLTLEDNIWKELNGGYKLRYDATAPLKQLENTDDKKEIYRIFDELWNELHHQGDVGVASYLAVPQLVRIAKQKRLFDWNILALCSTIEQQRHLGTNPLLPTEFREYYEEGLLELKAFIIDNLNSVKDEITLRSALSALAVCNGEIKLSKAIIKLSDDVLNEFLEQF